MLFSESIFLFLFLPLVLLLYVVIPQKGRNFLLTIASLFFYAYGELKFVPIMIASIIINYYFAIWISQTRGTPKATFILTLGVMSDLSLLLYFKYTNFFLDSFNSLLAGIGVHTPPLVIGAIGLPLGISFFTFHKISYKVDVFRGHAAAKRNPFDLALYILLFPQLIAGPIVRYNEISEQIGTAGRIISRDRFSKGASIFIVGLAKKMLIANVVALPADQIFSLPADQLTTPVAWLGILCYALQIYFDFSGYSEMAVGLACFFGFDFPANFNYPYIANSVTDFWRRWHISLSRWFRDYVYIPLGGNRVSNTRLYLNLVIVFFLCGLWHGASWNFVIWGIFHGLFLVLERLFLGRFLSKIPGVFRHVYLLLVILVGWVFFRTDSIPHATQYLAVMFGLHKPATVLYPVGLYLNREVVAALLLGIVASTPILPVTYRFFHRRFEPKAGEGQATPLFYQTASFIRFVGLVVCLFLSILSVVAGTYNPFIYFRF
jgi:alginate O-acetyltransferase complex protein AlgI